MSPQHPKVQTTTLPSQSQTQMAKHILNGRVLVKVASNKGRTKHKMNYLIPPSKRNFLQQNQITTIITPIIITTTSGTTHTTIEIGRATKDLRATFWKTTAFFLSNNGRNEKVPEHLPPYLNSKERHDYSKLCNLNASFLPQVGDLIAFKIVELMGMSPQLSDYKEGTVNVIDKDRVTILLDPEFITPPPPPTEEENDEYNDEDVYELQVETEVTADFKELVDPKLIKRDGVLVPNVQPQQEQSQQQQQPQPPQHEHQQEQQHQQLPSQQQLNGTPQLNQNNGHPQNHKRPRRRGGLTGLLVTLRREQQNQLNNNNNNTLQPQTQNSA